MTVLRDGHGTIITLGGSIEMYQKEVTPPGIEMGGGIEVSTMDNSEYETMYPKSLKKVTDGSITVAYDTAAYTSIMSQLGVNHSITVTFPDSSTLVFWGWIDSFVPNNHQKGEQPTASCTIIASNLNASGVETAPVRSA